MKSALRKDRRRRSWSRSIRDGIGILNVRRNVDSRQNFRAHLDVESLRPFDFLAGLLDIGIALERGQDRLVESETRERRPAQAHLSYRFSSRYHERSERDERQQRDADREINGSFTHG